MENLGQRITELRKKRNLTQSELGEKLNVTSQAVSKWENNLSEPDLETTKKLCEILEVSMSELLGLDDKATTSDAPAEQPAPVIIEKIVEKPVETPPSKIILGYCKECNKAVSNGEYVVSRDGVGVICNECNKQKNINRAKNNHEYDVSGFRKGLIWGGIILTIGLALGLIVGLYGASTGIYDAGITCAVIGAGALLMFYHNVAAASISLFLIGFGVGIYDGMIGPGTGTFLILAFTTFLGLELVCASGCAKVSNLASNLTSVVIYAFSGNIRYAIAIPAALCSITGSWLGAKVAVKGGGKRVKQFMYVVLCLLFAKMIFDLVG
jgi:transcriptional regulator with XRE-family HTH domain